MRAARARLLAITLSVVYLVVDGAVLVDSLLMMLVMASLAACKTLAKSPSALPAAKLVIRSDISH